ncbi:MAG TPA: TetR/AcrR family transcriptional regulator [Solirubrobacteraceae bacterium]|nr:TetR/AcrR family transcriptional regulator [Solirubrobacteraceae bacterium]
MTELTTPQPPVPRGRHAPPLEVRLEVQKQRLFDAAAGVFSRVGYADASAEAISRRAGMSKATFYEHFANKEECLVALFQYASEIVLGVLVEAARSAGGDFRDRHRAGLRSILELAEANPSMAQAILVETVGAGPRVAELRDRALNSFANVMYAETVHAAERGGGPPFASPDEAFAIVGATFELVSRQLRTGQPERLLDLEPLVQRLIVGLLSQPPE